MYTVSNSVVHLSHPITAAPTVGLTLPELRQMYFRMREEVLCGGLMSTAKKTDALEHLLKSNFGNINMRDKEFPRYVATTKKANLK